MEISPSEPILLPDFSVDSPIQIESIEIKDIPRNIGLDLRMDWSGISDKTIDHAFKVSCNGVDSYGAVVHRDDETGGGVGVGKGIAIIDTTKDILLGRGLMWIYDSRMPEHSQYPHVSWTRTNEDFRRKGLGLRRLCVLNALNMKYFDIPLSSGNLGLNSFGVWEKLFKLGKVDKHTRSSKGVYFTFKKD